MFKDISVARHKSRRNIYIEDGRIVEVGGEVLEAEKIFFGDDFILSPAFYNTHTHAAMTLLRGYGDDMDLIKWLREKIWPREAHLNEKDIYWGTRLAALEMIRSGTVGFADMYFYVDSVAKAVMDSGLKALVSEGFIDLFNEEKREEEIKKVNSGLEKLKKYPRSRIKPSLGPHAVYTVSDEGFDWIAEKADETQYPIQIHLLETRRELEDFLKEKGKSPVDYLENKRILRKGTIAAHSVHINDKEIEMFSHLKVVPSYCPASNMKLSVKGIMPAQKMINKGIMVTLGTDGAASNNSLNILEEMKFAALLGKGFSSPTDLSADVVFKMATEWGARALGFNAGKIEEGYEADLILFNRRHLNFIPGYNHISDIVYSANPSSIDTVICSGKILMENGEIDGEEEIIKNAQKAAWNLIKR